MVFFVLVLVLLWHPSHVLRHTRADMQRAQIESLEAAVLLFECEFGAYPPSDVNDSLGVPYCGAMKLAEAVTGKDLLGFHPWSAFRADGLDPNGEMTLYPKEPDRQNLKARTGPFLQPENANAYRLVDVYGEGNTGPFRDDALVLCDVFERLRPGGEYTGMPILYYRAAVQSAQAGRLYDHEDNQMLVSLGVPGEPNAVHPLSDPKRFCLNTESLKPSVRHRSGRADSFIPVSAGPDGLYGMADDVCNFDWKYRQ